MIEINNSEVKTLGADAVSMLRKLVSIPAYSSGLNKKNVSAKAVPKPTALTKKYSSR